MFWMFLRHGKVYEEVVSQNSTVIFVLLICCTADQPICQFKNWKWELSTDCPDAKAEIFFVEIIRLYPCALDMSVR